MDRAELHRRRDEFQADLRRKFGSHVVVGWVRESWGEAKFVVYLDSGDDVSKIPSEWYGCHVEIQYS